MPTSSPNDVLLSAYQAGLVTLAQIRELGAAAFARINAGNGEVRTNVGWGQAGKQFSFLTDLSATEVLAACAYAIRQIEPSSTGSDDLVSFPKFQ